MSAAVKSALLLAMTLIAGVLLGLVSARGIERRPFGPRRPPPMAGGLAQHMEDVIRPRDAAQAEQVRAVLERTAARNRDILHGVNDSLRASIERMQRELAPLLDDAQRARLDSVARKLPPVGGPAGMRGGGPPPFGRGGGPPPPEGPPPR